MTEQCYTDRLNVKNYNIPLPVITTERIFDQWISVINRHECASIISLPKFDRNYRVTQFLAEKQKTLEFDTRCLAISFQSLVSEEASEFIPRLNRLKSDKATQTIFFVLDSEWLLSATPHLIFQLQQYVLQSNRSTSFIFFFELDLFSPLYSPYVMQAPSFVQNVLYQKLYSPEDIDHFLQHMAKLYRFSLSEKERLEII